MPEHNGGFKTELLRLPSIGPSLGPEAEGQMAQRQAEQRPIGRKMGTLWAIGKTFVIGTVDLCVNTVENITEKALGWQWAPKVSPEPLTGKVCIITGGNAGIGRATAELLASRGAHVILACRSKERGEQAAAAIKSTCAVLPGCGDKPKVEFMQVDMASLASVRKFCENFNARRMPLHLLVANAGIMTPPARLETEDGLEMQFQVNFLGHWLMSHMLLAEQRTRRAKQGSKKQALPTTALQLDADTSKEFAGWGLPEDGTRVVFVTSLVHHSGFDNWKDMQSRLHYEPFTSYGLSKLCGNLSAWELQRRLTQQAAAPEGDKWGRDSAVAVHPGVVDTELGATFFKTQTLTRILPAAARMVDSVVHTVAPLAFKTTSASAAIVATAALAPAEKVAGKYMANGKVARPSAASRDQKLADELWTVAQELTGYTIPPCLA